MKNEKKVELVAGKYRPESTMARLFNLLKDGKARPISRLKSCAAEKGVNINHRLFCLGTRGRETRRWKLERADGKVRLILSSKSSKKVTHSHTSQPSLQAAL